MASLNLANRPFVNRRPLERIARALAVVGAVLLVVNGVLFWRYLSSSADLRSRLREVRAQSEAELRAMEGIERQLRAFDLEEQNQRVRFLNEKIAQRSFGWSQLFDQLSEVLPRDVKLYTLSPTVERRGRRRSRSRTPSREGERVVLAMSGVAKETEPLLELIDALFAQPAFEEPRLAAENRDESGQIRFELTAIYRPDRVGLQTTTLDEAAASAAVSAAPDPVATTTAGLPGSSDEAAVGVAESQSAAPPAGEPGFSSQPTGSASDVGTQSAAASRAVTSPEAARPVPSRPVPSSAGASRRDPSRPSVPGSPSAVTSFRPGVPGSRQETAGSSAATPNDRGATAGSRSGAAPSTSGTSPSDRTTSGAGSTPSQPVPPQRNASGPPGGGGGRR